MSRIYAITSTIETARCLTRSRGHLSPSQVIGRRHPDPGAMELRVRFSHSEFRSPSVDAPRAVFRRPSRCLTSPGYAIGGVVDACGAGVTRCQARRLWRRDTKTAGTRAISYWPAVRTGCESAGSTPPKRSVLVLILHLAYQLIQSIAKR